MNEPGSRNGLRAAFRAVADDEAGLTASPSVEARLLAEVRSFGATRRRRRVYASAAGVAAALIVVTALAAGRAVRRQSVSSPPPAPAAFRSEPGLDEVTTGFLPLTYSSVPITTGQLVRLEVPRSALAAFGLAPIEFLDSTSSGTVLADVLVGEDGLARAVRFVRLAGAAAHQEQKP